MKKRTATVFILLALLLGTWAMISRMRTPRPPAPPPGSPLVYPWGAMHADDSQLEPDSELEESLMESIEEEPAGDFDPDRDGRREYNILVLSGGGSHGAFGAGLLNGWTASGTRPDFKIVTGVSTGSLQATFAFLGSDHDRQLQEVFTRYDTDQIYHRRNLLHAMLSHSAFDADPLEELIATYITPEILEAVATKHAEGHRLFVGTSNMDTAEFIIWDLGEIASSRRDDKLEHYRRILRASCSIPVLFPPVYFDVKIDGQTYHEMHVDGGTQSQLFLRAFMLDFEDALRETGLAEDIEASLYIIRNGHADEIVVRKSIPGSSLSIASATIHGAFDLSTESSLFRVYALSSLFGIDFHMAAIPDSMFPDFDPIDFELTTMRRLYDYGFEQASRGYEWAKLPPGLDPLEKPRR